MENISFENIAPYLKNPLVLSGFAIFLLILFFRTIIKSGLIPTVTKSAGSQIINRTIFYGFIVSVIVIILGFTLEFIKIQNSPQSHQLEQQRIESLVFILAYNLQLLDDEENSFLSSDANEIEFCSEQLNLDVQLPSLEKNNLGTLKSSIERSILREHGLRPKQIFINTMAIVERCVFFRDDNIPLAISMELEDLIKPFNLPSRFKRIPTNNSVVWVEDLKDYYNEVVNFS